MSSMSSAGGSTLAKTMSITPPPQQQTVGTKRTHPDEDSDRPKKKARTEKKEGTRGRKKKDEDSDYSEEEHSQTPPLSRVNSLGEDFDVNARLKLLEDQQKQMEQQLEALKSELVLKDFVFKPASHMAGTMADPQVEEMQEKEEVKPKKRGRPAKKK